MPRIELYTNASYDVALDAVDEACKLTGFVIDDEGKRRLSVRKGSLALSICLGVFVVYASAEVMVERDEDEYCIDFNWGTTWWQGIFGPVRTKKAMVALIDRVEEILEEDGWKVLDRVDR